MAINFNIQKELTTSELLIYNKLKKNIYIDVKMLLFPYYFSFYLGIFAIVMALAFNIDLMNPLRKIITVLFVIHIPILISYILLSIFSLISSYKYNSELILKIISERKSLKKDKVLKK